MQFLIHSGSKNMEAVSFLSRKKLRHVSILKRPCQDPDTGGWSPGVHSVIPVLRVQWVKRQTRERKTLLSLRSLRVARAPRPLGGGGTGRSLSGH